MFLRSGRDTLPLVSSQRCGGSAFRSSFDEAAGRRSLGKRKSSGKGEAASPRQVRKLLPELPCKQSAALPAPAVAVSAHEVTSNGDESSDEASIAELGIKLFPHLRPSQAAALWVHFFKHVKACLKHYNRNDPQGNFVYKHVRGDGFSRVEEPDGTCYYHMNFTAQDENGRSQLFFGEIEDCDAPKEEDVTCCCPLFADDVGGKGIRTIEEAANLVFPAWNSMEIDQDNCYACRSRVKHPKGRYYKAGHIADARQYYEL